MANRMIQGVVIAVLVFVLPATGNMEILRAPHIAIVLIFGILASVLQPEYNPFTITAKPRDRGTGAQIIWSVYITQLTAVLEAAYLRYPQSVRWDAAAILALVAMILGLSLRTWAVFALGNLFTMHISVQQDHAVIRKGPYQFVRHPSYLGAFILYVSTAGFLHAWFSAAAAAVILPFAFLRRIHYEEELLKEELGEAYASYCAEVKRILPGIW